MALRHAGLFCFVFLPAISDQYPTSCYSVHPPRSTPSRHLLSRGSRRILRHLLIFVATSLGTALAFGLVRSNDPLFRASMATAYVAMALFAVTLAFGPVAALRGRRYPVNTDVRRDYGIWSGVMALAHVVFGLQVHMRGKMIEYFVREYSVAKLPRVDLFGFENYTGLVAVIIFAALLVTSNNASLRWLGTVRWQAVHRWVYLGLAVTIAHGIAYQVLEKRTLPFVMVFASVSLALLCLQYARWRRKGTDAPASVQA